MSNVSTSQDGLIHNAQAFLKSQLEHIAPDAVLTQAWDEFYQVYTENIRRLARRFQVAAGDVDDVVQAVWSEVIQRLPGLRFDSQVSGLRAWLFTVVRSKALDLIRQLARHPVRSLDQVSPDHEPAVATAEPPSLAEEYWRQELVHTVLGQLEGTVSPVNIRLLHLRWIEGRDTNEVAAELGMTPKQVTGRQKRLFRKLRAALAVYVGDQFGSRE